MWPPGVGGRREQPRGVPAIRARAGRRSGVGPGGATRSRRPRPAAGSVRVQAESRGGAERTGRLGPCGKRPSREPSLPGLERGTRDPFTCAERGDRQTAGELSVEALPPGVCEIQVFGACHERAPGLGEGDQPSSIATVARLDLPCAYVEKASSPLLCTWFCCF